jgi:hypothetical protein
LTRHLGSGYRGVGREVVDRPVVLDPVARRAQPQLDPVVMGTGRDVFANPVSVAVVEQDSCLVKVLDPEAIDQDPTRVLNVEAGQECLCHSVQYDGSRGSFGTNSKVILRNHHRLVIRPGADEDRRPWRGGGDGGLNRCEIRLLALRLVVVDDKDVLRALRGWRRLLPGSRRRNDHAYGQRE